MSNPVDVHDLSKLTVGFVGGGNMAYAIAAGLISKGVLKPGQIIVSAKSLANMQTRWKPLNVTRCTIKSVEVLTQADIIFLCVKPHVLSECATQIVNDAKGIDCAHKILVSILAGVTLKRLNDVFGSLGIPIVRTMPNTPMQVAEGCTVFCAKFGASQQYENVKFILNQLGIAFEVKEEQINGITGLTGCGPAYVYEIIEALADGAVKQGVSRDMALKMAAQTVMGAAKTVLETGKHPAVLKDEVCSPGGATIYGVHELEKGAMRSTLINAVEKASARAAELQ
ncbi:uncharacterized protein LOC131437716 [Malaya genurostris]|uniref:uncharacterized protein LOC131437716 n=1 Tax=Malaya genurostris TaxID=325434 RepID=UPI0026F3AF9C|nr:uncharacterized protein LOC131437716 [Malaya genurostris]